MEADVNTALYSYTVLYGCWVIECLYLAAFQNVPMIPYLLPYLCCSLLLWSV